MTTKPAPVRALPTAATAIAIPPPPRLTRLTLLPDPMQELDRAAQSPHISRVELILGARYRRRPDVLVCSGGYLCYSPYDISRTLYPACMVSFALTNITPAEIIAANSYMISDVGKPPEFVLEVASEGAYGRVYTEKRRFYAGLKVVEYWHLDRTGGRLHDAALAGDRLNADGNYEPIPIYEYPDGTLRGYSAVLELELELHWVEGWLRFWDPAVGEYLRDLDETTDFAEAETERADANAERAAAAAERADAEALARQQAEVRVRQLEAALEQCRQAGH